MSINYRTSLLHTSPSPYSFGGGGITSNGTNVYALFSGNGTSIINKVNAIGTVTTLKEFTESGTSI